MLKIKRFYLYIAVTVMVLSVFIYNTMLDDKSNSAGKKNDSLVSLLGMEVSQSLSKELPKATMETYEGLEAAKSKAPFPIKFIDTSIEALATEGTSLTIKKTETKTVHAVMMKYSNKNGKAVVVNQITETIKPEELLEQCEKVSVNGLEAWIYDPAKDDEIMQLLMWKDGKYYNVMSNKISKDNLIKIAASLL